MYEESRLSLILQVVFFGCFVVCFDILVSISPYLFARSGVCACSTCHIILPYQIYDDLPEPSEDEEDMLDMAFGLMETSRLGCQVIVTEDMDELEIEMPKATRNFYVDGHVPKPH